MVVLEGSAESLAQRFRNDTFTWITPAAVGSSIIAIIVHLSMWSGFFRRYRARLFRMRSGEYFFDRKQMDETGASSFVGYQVAYMVFSTGVLLTIGFVWLVILAVASIALLGAMGSSGGEAGGAGATIEDGGLGLNVTAIIEISGSRAPVPPAPPAPDFGDAYSVYASLLARRLGTVGLPQSIWYVAVAFLFQYIFNKYVWFTAAERTRNGHITGRWLRLRFWYSVYEYMLILPNVAIGMVLIIFRLFFSFFLWLYYTFSIDICIVPSASSVESWDAGYGAYVAAARNDHRYNNPIVMVFVENLQHDLKQRRLESGRIKLSHNLQRNAALRKAGLPELTEKMIPKPKEVARGVVDHDPEAAEGTPGRVARFLKPVRTCLDASDQVDEYEAFVADDGSGVPAAQDEIDRLKTYRRVCRRWQLYLKLVQNPALCNSRASKLSTHGLPEIDDSKVFADAGKALVATTSAGIQGAANLTVAGAKGVAAGAKAVAESPAGKATAAAVQQGAQATAEAAQKAGQAIADAPATKAAVAGIQQGASFTAEQTGKAAKAVAETTAKVASDIAEAPATKATVAGIQQGASFTAEQTGKAAKAVAEGTSKAASAVAETTVKVASGIADAAAPVIGNIERSVSPILRSVSRSGSPDRGERAPAPASP